MRDKSKLVVGIGINDSDYPVTINDGNKQLWMCPYYEDWKNVLHRCYSKKSWKKRPTYIGCEVCDDWKLFSNFRRWVDEQPNRDWQNCQLDKDLLGDGKLYSPETCVYIPQEVNKFIIDHNKRSGKYMIGVNLYIGHNNRISYMARCSNPNTGEREYLGLFPTEMEAHIAWRNKKRDMALSLAEKQEDPRVKKFLLNMYVEKSV